jgi:Ni/Fe-hydrogenase 1 B-type cytochrome subunit
MASIYRTLKAGDPLFGRQYVWQLPVRLSHWINVISIAALFLTGLYINHPVLAPNGEPYNNFVMGRIRQIHFAFGYILLFSFLVRVYWFYVGNNYARSGFPLVWQRSWWADLTAQSIRYLKLERGHVHLGHNALAGLAYTIMVIGLGWLQIITGFALYSESNPGGFWNRLLGWVIPLFGGSFRLHTWHHLFGWGFLIFAIVHVYVVLFDDRQYKNGLISSMIAGFKFYEKGDLDHDTWLS